mgnify:FL=1
MCSSDLGSGGFIPIRQSQVSRQRSNVSFGKSCFHQGAADSPFACGRDAGAIIAEIIEIRPVDNNRLRAKCAQFSHQLVEIGFTVKAAASIVRGEGGYCELVGFNQLMARADFFRDTCCSFQLDCGERRGNCRDPDGGISELIVGDFQDEGAVDPTGVRDQYGIHSRKNLAQMKKLVFE